MVRRNCIQCSLFRLVLDFFSATDQLFNRPVCKRELHHAKYVTLRSAGWLPNVRILSNLEIHAAVVEFIPRVLL